MILPIEHPIFTYERIFDSPENLELIKKFAIQEKSGLGLEFYLKETAAEDEKNQLSATYLLKDKITKEIAGYFSLKAGLFTISTDDDDYFDAIPAMELANFAVNSLYRVNHPDVKSIGATMLSRFVVPIFRHVRNFIAVRALYIYALPEERLIQHYETLGFHRLESEEEAFVHSHVKPRYDDGCIFMYQIL